MTTEDQKMNSNNLNLVLWMYIHSGMLVQKQIQINLELYLVDWLLEEVLM